MKKELALQTLGMTTLPADLAEILAAYGTANTGTTNAQNMVAGLSQDYQGLMSTVQQMRQAIINYADATLTDFDTVTSLLAGASSQDINTILGLLYQDMLDNAQSVQQSVVALGAVSADASNVGSGTILLDNYLDGFQPGVSGGFQHIRYAGIKSELAPATLGHTFTCVGDSYSGGTSAGSETFSWNDSVNFGAFSSYPEGAGAGPGLASAGSSNLPSNGGFENWSGGLPTGWTLLAGGTNTGGAIAKDTVSVFVGTSALKITGNGSGQLVLRSSLGQGAISPRRRYNISFVALQSGAPASGVLVAYFSGTGYTPSASEQISISVTQLSTTYVRYNFYFTAPANVPSDLAINIGVTGTLPTGKIVKVTSLFIVPVVFFAGINAAVVPGSTPFVVGDKFYATVTSVEGVIQKFFRLKYLMQLPSSRTVVAGPFGGLLLNYTSMLYTVNGNATLLDSLAQ